jgi:hypothetical protein
MNATRSALSRVFTGLLLAATAGWLFLPSASAQSGGGAPPPFAGHWGGRMGGPGGPGGWGHRGSAKVVTGEPYTAQAVTSTVNTLPNGTNISRQITAQIARDNQGRTMRSETFSGFGAAGSQNAANIVSIFDPVANQRIEYNTSTKIAHVFVLPTKSNESEEGSSEETHANHNKLNRPGQGNVQSESLGAQTISGLSAEGTRTTRTIPAGAIGNNKPIVSTDEKWYSSDLQIVLQSTRNDPRVGQVTYTVSNLQRAEPNASLFQVPAGYQTKTVDVPAHNR